MTHIRRSTCAVLLLVLISSSLAWAQASSVAGRVVDPQGAAVANAEITLAAPGQSARSVRSAQDGTFRFESIAPGTYTVRTEGAGFSPSSETVTVGPSPVPLTITLQVAGLSEDVTVRGALMATVATGKTTLPVRDLPLTIQSVSSEVIAEQGANDLITALKNVPGVHSFTTYGIYEYDTFRGFFDSALLLDGVRNDGDRVNRTNTQLTNVDRIEVLKGPSSALYGSGALGATINLIRKKPAATPAYDFTGSVGSWKTGRVAFGSAGRLGGDAVLYRFDVGSETKEGYRHNDTTRLNVTPSLQWRFGNNQLNAYYTFNRDRFGGDAGLPLTDTDFDVPVEDNVLPVPLDRNYRTPQDDATSYDHNIQVAYARQLSNSLGFRNTLSYRHFDDEYFHAEEIDFSPPSTINRYYLYSIPNYCWPRRTWKPSKAKKPSSLYEPLAAELEKTPPAAVDLKVQRVLVGSVLLLNRSWRPGQGRRGGGEVCRISAMAPQPNTLLVDLSKLFTIEIKKIEAAQSNEGGTPAPAVPVPDPATVKLRQVQGQVWKQSRVART